MKLKRILGGALAAALVVTSLPTAGFGNSVALAAPDTDEDTKYVYARLTPNDEWTATTDAGTYEGSDGTYTAEDVDGLLDEAGSTWRSEDTGHEGGPVEDTEFVRNNKITINLGTPGPVTKIVYVARDGAEALGGHNGRIKNANVYVVKEDNSQVQVLTADTAWNYTDGDNTKASYTIPVNGVDGNIKQIIIEVKHTDGDTVTDPSNTNVDRYISGREVKLYSSESTQIAYNTLTAASEADAHTGNEVSKLVDGDETDNSLFETEWNTTDTSVVRPFRKGLTSNNNIYITLPASQLLGMLTYVTFEETGSIRYANVYVSNEDLEEGKTAKDITDWGEPVYSAEQEWSKYDAHDALQNGHNVQWTPREVQHIRIEVTHTWGTYYQDRNKFISGKFIRLYEAIPVINVAVDGKTTIAAYSGHSSQANSQAGGMNVNHVISNSGNDEEQNNNRWAAGPNLKSGKNEGDQIEGAKNYVVLDLGEGTRTVVQRMEIRWHYIAYAKHYVIETSDTCTIEPADINQAPWTDKKLADSDSAANWEKVAEVTRETADGFKLDTVEADGVRGDNGYFENPIELKRYVRLVADDMNLAADLNSISIREWDIYGYKRQLGYDEIESATVTVNLPVAGEAPGEATTTDTDYEITDTVWTDGYGNTIEDQFPATGSYRVTATLTPKAGKRFTVDSKITLQDQLGSVYRVEKDIKADGTLLISHTYYGDKEPEKGEQMYTGVDLGSADTGDDRSNTAWFYQDMVDDATVTTVFKLSEENKNGEYALLTLTDDDNAHHITLGYNPALARFQMSFKGFEGSSGDKSSSAEEHFSASGTSPFKVTDTKYHKISFSLVPNGTSAATMGGRLVIKIDGQQVLTSQSQNFFEHAYVSRFFTKLHGWTPTKVYVGGTVGSPDSSLKPFSQAGSIKYLKVEKNQGFNQAIPSHSNVEAGATLEKQVLLDAYDRLDKDEYTSASWQTAQDAQAALAAATTEWDIWNAIDAMNAAMSGLVAKHIAQPLISVVAPKEGAQTADAEQAEEDSRYTLATQWYSGDSQEDITTEVARGTAFDAAKYYKVKVTLTAASGFAFRDSGKPVSIKVGDVLIPLEDGSVTVGNSGNSMDITYTFDKENANTNELSALLNNEDYPEEQGNYTNESWAAYVGARRAARSLVTASTKGEYVSAKSVAQAKANLEAMKNALLTRIEDPELQVAQPVYNGAQEAVTSRTTGDNYEVSYKWYKVGDDGSTTEMSPGETYKDGVYKVTATLTAKTGYGFDETSIPSHIHVGEDTQQVEVAFDGAAMLLISWSCTIEEIGDLSSRTWTVGETLTNAEYTMTPEDQAFFGDLQNENFVLDVVFRYNETGYAVTGKRNALVTFSDGTTNLMTLWHDPNQNNNNAGGTCVAGATSPDGFKFNNAASFVGDTLWHKITLVIERNSSSAQGYRYYAMLDGKNTLNNQEAVSGWDPSAEHVVALKGFMDGTWTTSKIYFGKKDPNVTFTTGSSFNDTFDGTIKSVSVRKVDAVTTDGIMTDHKAIPAEAQAAYDAAKAQCNGLVENKYTAESWAALQTALAADHSTEWATYNAADAILAAKAALVPDCGCTVTIDSFTLEDITLTGASATATLDAKVTATKGSECTEPDHTDTTANVVYTATGAGASVSGNTLTVTSAGNVTVTATATFNGKTATMDATAVVTSSALSDLNSYVDETREEYASQGDYSDASWGALQDALEAAEALKDQATVTEQEISDAKQAIEDAIAGLETQEEEDRRNLVNSLKDLMDEVEEKSQHSGDYDVDSYNELIEAYNAAVEVYNDNANKSKDELQAAFDALQAANDALKTKGEKAEEDLQKALEEAQQVLDAGQGNYTNEAWQAFQDAYNNAKNHASGLTAEEIQDLLNKLNAAKNALSGVDAGLAQAQANLNAMLADAKKTLDAGKGACPDAVWSAFQNAYNAANAGKNGTDAAKLVTLYNALKTALANVKSAQSASASNLPKPGSQYTVGKLVYQVKTSSVTDKTVMVVKPSKKTNKKLTIPATVKISGFAYKVVEIKQSAFAKNKKLTSVKIGKNVVKIGKKAFFRCAKLKKVTIKASGLKTVGKQAFAKINKKARIRVPKKQLKTLKKKLKKAKTIKSAKITK